MSIQQFGNLLISSGAAVLAVFVYLNRKLCSEKWRWFVDFVAAQLGFVRMAAFNELAANYMDAGTKLAAERSRSSAAWLARDHLLGRVQELEAAQDDTQRMAKGNLDREWMKSLAGDLERAAETYGNVARKSEGPEASYYNGKQLTAVETASRVRRYLGARTAQ